MRCRAVFCPSVGPSVHPLHGPYATNYPVMAGALYYPQSTNEIQSIKTNGCCFISLRALTDTMRTLSLILALIAPAAIVGRRPRSHELTASYSYEAYTRDFSKHPTPEGKALFKSNLNAILAHNANPSKIFTMGVNAFTDEPSGPTRGRKSPPASMIPSSHRASLESDPRVAAMLSDGLPDSVDWRTSPGVVSAVKNQVGRCGAVVSFFFSQAHRAGVTTRIRAYH